MKVPDINYQEEIKKCKSMDDVVGKNGLMQKLLKDVMQQLLEAEMDEHLGREKYERADNESEKNYRNGYSKKDVRSSYGEVPIDIPRDRNSEFEPKAIRKYETDCSELDKKIIGLYGR
jgi:transposase-like protein